MIQKFRVWDIETERFFYWKISENPPTCLTGEYLEKHAEEYTGIKDRNGMEIYKHDILRYIDPWGRKEVNHIEGVVYFGTDEYSVPAQGANDYQNFHGWLIRTILSFSKPLTKDSCIEIAGNTHETPELMEP